MSNAMIVALAWFAAILHVSIGVLAWRRGSAILLLPAINFVVALCVLLYWAREWVAVLSKGITWYASDQLLPAYALAVCVLAVLALTGRLAWSGVHWTIFGAHTIVAIAAALFFTFFRMNRLF